jgi:intein C-terminal splicing region
LLTGEIELKPVLEVLKTYNQGNTLKLKFTENIEIETTFNHEFMTSDGKWITAEELDLGTKVYTLTGEIISLEAKEITRNVNPKIMYDLEVEDNHNYLITEEDMLVHNGNCPAIAKQVENAVEEAKKLGKKHIKVKLKGYPNVEVLDKLFKKKERN